MRLWWKVALKLRVWQRKTCTLPSKCLMNWQGKSNNSLTRCSSIRSRKKKCPLSKALSHQHHLRLTSTSHHRFRLLSLHLSKMMILMTLLPIRQKLNSQAQRHNAYTITPHQWSSQQQEEWRSCFDGKTWFLLLLQRFDGEARFLLLSSLETVQYRYSILSLFYRPLRIRLKRQNPLLSYVQDSEKVHH